MKDRLKEIIPEKRDEIKQVKAELGKMPLGTITVDMLYGGMRGIKGLIYETSLLDPEEVQSSGLKQDFLIVLGHKIPWFIDSRSEKITSKS